MKMRRRSRHTTTNDGQQGMSESEIQVWEGEILAYWEQGMEGRIEFAFQAANLDRPIFLENGQHLSIYDEDGTVVWSGNIELVRRRFWDRHNLREPVWSYTKQKGVSYKQWMAWFWRKPPLKARLVMRP